MFYLISFQHTNGLKLEEEYGFRLIKSISNNWVRMLDNTFFITSKYSTKELVDMFNKQDSKKFVIIRLNDLDLTNYDNINGVLTGSHWRTIKDIYAENIDKINESNTFNDFNLNLKIEDTIQWKGDNIEKMKDFCNDLNYVVVKTKYSKKVDVVCLTKVNHFYLEIGDYLIKTKDEIFFFQKDIFETIFKQKRFHIDDNKKIIKTLFSNLYKKYKFLELNYLAETKQITEDEFNEEIKKNKDLYTIKEDKDVNITNIESILEFIKSCGLKNLTLHDIIDLFEIKKNEK